MTFPLATLVAFPFSSSARTAPSTAQIPPPTSCSNVPSGLSNTSPKANWPFAFGDVLLKPDGTFEHEVGGGIWAVDGAVLAEDENGNATRVARGNVILYKDDNGNVTFVADGPDSGIVVKNNVKLDEFRRTEGDILLTDD